MRGPSSSVAPRAAHYLLDSNTWGCRSRQYPNACGWILCFSAPCPRSATCDILISHLNSVVTPHLQCCSGRLLSTHSTQSCPDTAGYPGHSFLVSLSGPKGSSAETALVSDQSLIQLLPGRWVGRRTDSVHLYVAQCSFRIEALQFWPQGSHLSLRVPELLLISSKWSRYFVKVKICICKLLGSEKNVFVTPLLLRTCSFLKFQGPFLTI